MRKLWIEYDENGEPVGSVVCEGSTVPDFQEDPKNPGQINPKMQEVSEDKFKTERERIFKRNRTHPPRE